MQPAQHHPDVVTQAGIHVQSEVGERPFIRANVRVSGTKQTIGSAHRVAYNVLRNARRVAVRIHRYRVHQIRALRQREALSTMTIPVSPTDGYTG